MILKKKSLRFVNVSEGQDVSSQAECAKYSACQWVNEECSMQDNGQIGYIVTSAPEDTGRGFKVSVAPIKLLYQPFKIWLIIIYHDFRPPPRRGSHVKSYNTHNHPTYTP